MTETKENINIKLSGMTCANCALKIETKLNSLGGVDTAVVNFANEEATVQYDPNTTNYNIMKAAVKDLGYSASLARIELKVVDELTEENFENLINEVLTIKGIYDVRGNFKALKLFIGFNELELDEIGVYSIVKKLVSCVGELWDLWVIFRNWSIQIIKKQIYKYGCTSCFRYNDRVNLLYFNNFLNTRKNVL